MTTEIAAPAVEVAVSAQEPSQPTTDVNKEAEAQELEGKPEKTPQEIAFEKRIARQTAANRDTQRQLQEEKKQREAVEARLKEFEAKLSPLADKPNPDNFDTTEDYAEALADWKIDQKAKADQKPKEPSVDEKVAEVLKAKEFETTFRQKETAFREATPDYDSATKVVNGLLAGVNKEHPSTIAFASTLLNAPNPFPLIHYLGTHPAEAIEMMGMTPFEIQDRLGMIIDQLDEPKAEEDDSSEISPKADLPPPPRTLSGAAKVKKGLNDMSPRELVRWSEGKK